MKLNRRINANIDGWTENYCRRTDGSMDRKKQMPILHLLTKAGVKKKKTSISFMKQQKKRAKITTLQLFQSTNLKNYENFTLYQKKYIKNK